MSKYTDIKYDIEQTVPEISELVDIMREAHSTIHQLMITIGKKHNIDHDQLIQMFKSVYGDKHAVVELNHSWLLDYGI